MSVLSRIGCLLVAIAMALAMSPCAVAGYPYDSYDMTGEVMGTSFSVKFVVPRYGFSDDPSSALESAINAMHRYDDLMSTYDQDSELSKFNAFQSDQPFKVSEETAETTALAKQISEETGGAFEPTLGPLVRLWNFGPGREELPEPPSDEAIKAAIERIGVDKLTVDMDALTLTKASPELDLDLSGIAKGAAVDAACEALEDAGVESYMVEIGGEVRAKGQNAEGRTWRIAIENPVAGVRDIGEIIELDGLSIATSGDYRNYYEKDGKRFSHIIDPRAGRPIEHRLASVSVLDSSCARADALATALMVMGPDEGFAFAKENDIAARLVIREEQGEGFLVKTTPAFDRLAAASQKTDDVQGSPLLVTIAMAVGVFCLVFFVLSWKILRGKSHAKCACSAAKQAMRAYESKEAVKNQREGRGDPKNLPLLPPGSE